jgi:hypothetical protein
MHFPDNLKLKSSMTLFKQVEEVYNIDCGNIFQKILDKFFNGEEDPNTIRILEKQKFEKQMGKNNNLEIQEKNEVIPIEDKEDIKDELNNKGYDFNFELNNKVNEANVEKEDKDEMKIEEETNEMKENDKENNNHIDDDIDSFKAKYDDMEIVEEKDEMIIKDENVNLLDQEDSKKKLSEVNNDNNDNNNNSNNNLNNGDTNLTKRKTVHFSLPSRSQMKNMDNNGNKKSDVEMMIDNNPLEKKDTVVVYPFDETEEKKCCPECCIF